MKDVAMWKGKEASENVKGNASVFGYCLQGKAEGAEMANNLSDRKDSESV